ncbi:DUF6807 family protein [Mangrovibacterium lignilyticum]|uniref:DUF6807 family protein n=1 Tax=Mangrovibacterium lignilyticum TaxID=2668052 RepID=UPI0013D67CAE|nr:DUF6807 family protein [Mangrovibacterium lignilyticum]
MIKNLTTTIFLLIMGVGSVSAQISMKKEQGGFWITDGGKNVAFYQKEPMGFNFGENRNNFLHPVMLPDGTSITENAPDDHPHHRGIFWAWHQILINNQPVGDGWEMKDFLVAVKSVEFKRLMSGDGELQTTAFWSSPLYKGGEEAYLKEITTYTFHKQKNNYRIIHFTIRLISQVDDLKLGGSDDDKGYGGFSARIKLPEDVHFKSDAGPITPQNNAVRAGDYIEIIGSMARNGNGQGGVIIYADPKNPMNMQSWILREQKSMQNAVFPGKNPFQLEKDLPLELNYTLVLFTGNIKERTVLKEIQLDDSALTKE